jgi:hypothetical protein
MIRVRPNAKRTKLIELNASIVSLSNQVISLERQRDRLLRSLQSSCSHSGSVVVDIPFDYYSQVVCKCCGKRFERRRMRSDVVDPSAQEALSWSRIIVGPRVLGGLTGPIDYDTFVGAWEPPF